MSAWIRNQQAKCRQINQACARLVLYSFAVAIRGGRRWHCPASDYGSPAVLILILAIIGDVQRLSRDTASVNRPPIAVAPIPGATQALRCSVGASSLRCPASNVGSPVDSVPSPDSVYHRRRAARWPGFGTRGLVADGVRLDPDQSRRAHSKSIFLA